MIAATVQQKRDTWWADAMIQTSNSDRHAPDRFRTSLWMSLLVPIFLFLVISRGGTQLFASTQHGLVFNAIGESLLQGRFDIDPVVIGDEAFVRDGKAYPYFGIFPALLRLPLLLIPGLSDVNFSRCFLWIALSIGALAQMAIVRAAFHPVAESPARELVYQRLILVSVFAGPPIWLSMVGSIFDEASAWSWALSSTFVALVMRQLTSPDGFTARSLSAAAFVAGCCALTRPTVGFGLSVALCLLMVWILLQRHDGARRLSRMMAPRILVPAMILAAFALTAMAVNYGRWGNPFTIGDVRLQIYQIEMFPDRLPRLEQYGYFNITRLRYGLIYYFFPVWVLRSGDTLMFEPSIRTLFDAFEMPPASFFVTDALTMVLAFIGCLALFRDRLAGIPRLPVMALVGGLSIAPAIMLTAWYMAFRYRLDFVPLFFTLACIGGAAWARASSGRTPNELRRAETAFAVLLSVQCLSSIVVAALYLVSAHGPAHEHLQSGVLEYYRSTIGRSLSSP